VAPEMTLIEAHNKAMDSKMLSDRKTCALEWQLKMDELQRKVCDVNVT